jgi:hypothetical protein
MQTRVLLVFIAALALGVGVGCKNKGPIPGSSSDGDAPKVGSPDTSGAHPGAANPHAGATPNGGDPHAGMAMNTPSAPAPKVDASGMLAIGAIKFAVPTDWKAEAPTSSMRRAQLKAPGGGGDAELVVYYFGPQGAGSDEDNVKRWVGQFSGPGGTQAGDAKVGKTEVAGGTATTVDVAGQYTNAMMQGGSGAATKTDQRLLAAIVPSGDGPYYFKFLGPSETVGAQAKAFDGLIRSIEPASAD